MQFYNARSVLHNYYVLESGNICTCISFHLMMMECIIKFKVTAQHFRSFFLGDKQLYVQRVAAEAHVVMEQVVCYMPDITH